MLKVIAARITAQPQRLFDPMPVVFVTTEDGVEHCLWSYFPDEISFTESEFIGLTLEEAAHRKHEKDLAFLRS